MGSTSADSRTRLEWQALMDKVKLRDRKAFEAIFVYYSPRLKQFTFKHMGNEQVALELVQETMSVVWQKAHLFNGEKSSLSTWIYTVARNLCFDLMRKQKGKELHVHSEDIWPGDFCPPDFVEHYSPELDRLKLQVVKFLDTLPEAQKQVVQAVYLDDMPQMQVAEMLNVPLGTVKSRLRLAVEKLRHTIGEDL